MTHEQMEQHRKRFEELLLSTDEWSRKELERDAGEYIDWQLQAIFKGYTMRADNLEVELPAPAQFYTAEIVYLDELIAKLESQGIKVRPYK